LPFCKLSSFAGASRLKLLLGQQTFLPELRKALKLSERIGLERQDLLEATS
jgi:hypothetical protein